MVVAAAQRCTVVAAAGQRVQLQPAQRGAFRAAALRRVAAAPRRRAALAAQAYVREWTDPEFAAETLASFPDQAIATVEEARCLIEKGGYKYLDVRPTLELEEVGKWRGCINVPLVNSSWKYNAETRKKEVVKEDNLDFIAQVQKKIPNKDTPIVVGCSNGTTYSIDALELLDEAGYTNLVGLKGGFYAWFRVFDNKGGRRRSGEYAEQYTHDGDSCGIHSSGAGFDKVDKIEAWVPPSF